MTASAQGQQGAGRRCLSHQKDHTMLCDRHPDCPQPGDIAQLTRGNSIGADPTDTFVIVEDFPRPADTSCSTCPSTTLAAPTGPPPSPWPT